MKLKKYIRYPKATYGVYQNRYNLFARQLVLAIFVCTFLIIVKTYVFIRNFVYTGLLVSALASRKTIELGSTLQMVHTKIEKISVV